MGEIAENSQWFEGRSGVRREYDKTVSAVLNAVAARGHSMFPGFAVDALTGAEMESKLKLVELNKTIMQAAIEREMRAYGLENDLALKSALMAWEADKQALLTELDKEMAAQKAVRDMTEEEIAGLVLAQEYREVGILIAKTAIEMEIEDIKKQIEELELTPLPLERQLAAARLLTAQRKQAVIPYILSTIEAQRDVMDAEENIIMPARRTKAETESEIGTKILEIIPYLQEKASAMLRLATAKATLLPLLTAKATATEGLAAEIIAQLPNRVAIASVKEQQADERLKKVQDDLLTMGKELEEQGGRLEVELERINLEVQRAQARKLLAEDLRVQLGNIMTQAEREAENEAAYNQANIDNAIEMKTERVLQVEQAKVDAAVYRADKSGDAEKAMADDDYAHQLAMADQTANANLTEKLIHLLS